MVTKGVFGKFFRKNVFFLLLPLRNPKFIALHAINPSFGSIFEENCKKPDRFYSLG
jgi:hypothetical protein